MNTTTPKVPPARRLRRTVVAAVTALTAGATASVVAAQEDSEGASIDAAGQCSPIHMVMANGTFDSAVTNDPNSDKGFFGNVYKQVDSAASDSGMQGDDGAPAVSRSYVNYHAAAGGAVLPGAGMEHAVDAPSYRDSMNGGVEEALRQISEVAENCEDTDFVLAGYSQGAEVIENAARQIGNGDGPVDPERVVGVSLFASPTRQAEELLHVGGGDAVTTRGEATEQATTGLSGYPTPAGGGLSFDKTGTADFGELADDTVSWCLNGDLVCGLPIESEAIRTIVDGAEDADLSDPVKTLEELSDGISQAMIATDVGTSDVSTVDFGEDGFSLDGATPATGDSEQADDTTDAEPSADASEAPQSAASEPASPTSDEASTSGESSTPEETPSATQAAEPTDDEPTPSAPNTAADGDPAPAEPPARVNPLAGLQPFLDSARETSAELESGDNDSSEMAYDLLDGGAEMLQDVVPDMPAIPRAEEGTPGAAVQNVGDRLMPALTDIGGMALGAAVTTTKRTLTPENLTQIASAGVTAGPEAAGAVTMAKFAESGQVLLQPEHTSMFSRRAMNSLSEHDLIEGELAEIAVSLANWESINAHTEYGNRSMMPDGRTAIDATVDWVLATAQDAGAGGELPADSDESGVVGSLGESILDVEYDTDAATDALASLAGDVSDAGGDE